MLPKSPNWRPFRFGFGEVHRRGGHRGPVVENLQREDIHPLEEALGFRSLLELKDGPYTVASIAARAGKSEAYVYSRVKLTDLTPPVADAFLNDKITTMLC